MIVDYANVTLHELYSEWFDYKVKTVARSTTAFRIDADWRKFYENDPLSAGIISTPIFQIRRTDVEIWAAGLIRKYKMTRKCWCNAFTPMRQMLLYAMDRGDIDVSSIISIHLNSSLFFKQRKPDADTQIFFDDEVRLVIDAAVEACMQTTVSYKNLDPTKTYVVKGQMMEKNGKVLVAGGKNVTSEIKFTPKEANGAVDVEFTFNTTGLGNQTLVVFEEVYEINDEGKEVLVGEHKDLNDEGQSVRVVERENPKTGDNTPSPLPYAVAAGVMIHQIIIL